MAAFVFAGAVGYFIVSEAIANNFDISVGGGILRASVAIVIDAFGALLLRESGRHFLEADTAEDVALSLKALAPFYANSDDEIRLGTQVTWTLPNCRNS